MRSPATRPRKPGASRLSCPRRFRAGGVWPLARALAHGPAVPARPQRREMSIGGIDRGAVRKPAPDQRKPGGQVAAYKRQGFFGRRWGDRGRRISARPQSGDRTLPHAQIFQR